jgi:hypothetical protein
MAKPLSARATKKASPKTGKVHTVIVRVQAGMVVEVEKPDREIADIQVLVRDYDVRPRQQAGSGRDKNGSYMEEQW